MQADGKLGFIAFATSSVGEQRRGAEAFKLAFAAARDNVQPDAAKLAALLRPLAQCTANSPPQ